MTRAVAILSAALLAATLGVAQDTSQSGTTGTQNTPSTSTPSTPDQSSTSSTSSQGTTSTTDQSSQSTQNTNTMSSSGQNTTIQGCLSASAMGDNNFTLTQDQTGTVYTLTGNTADLKSHVGHEVSISGQAVSGNAASANTSSGAPSSSTGSSATANAGGNTLQVSSVQRERRPEVRLVNQQRTLAPLVLPRLALLAPKLQQARLRVRPQLQ